MKIIKKVNPHFEDFLFDWNYKRYLLVGGYGSSKSYHIALKILLKLLKEKRTCLVVREVYQTVKDSVFGLFKELVGELNLESFVKITVSPFELHFLNGSGIIFRGLDNTEKLKSIHNVSILWIEECSEISFESYKELILRARHPNLPIHFILSTNPVSEENWVFTHFFKADCRERFGKSRFRRA